MTRNVLLLTMIAVSLYACYSDRNHSDVEKWMVAPTDPISAVGHGAILNAEGKEIDPSPEFVIEAQRFYLKRLYQLANDQQRTEFKAKQQRLREMKGQTEAEQIVVNSALIAWLIEAVTPQEAAYLASKNTALRSRFIRIADGELSTEGVGVGELRKELPERLEQVGLWEFISPTVIGGPAYVAECREAGVPIPPDWGNSNWKYLGNTLKFIELESTAEVFVFESNSPRGVCFALPRVGEGTIFLLGIICLGTDTSKSCFWDSQDKIPINTAVPLSKFIGGADLYAAGKGVCTDCHAGENPFVVHPGQPMDLGSKLIPKNWPHPLVHPSWPQNPGPTDVLQDIALNPGEGSCLKCHDVPPHSRFPEVSTALPGYCGTILPNAILTTMPPGSPGVNATYAKHKNALLAACKQGGVIINGATQSKPTSHRSDSGGDLSVCPGGADCPPGFCYWRTLHGPFWQTTPSSIPIGDASYRGSFVRIYAETGKWKWRAFNDPTGGPLSAPPGGTADCTRYNEIATVPDPTNCFANSFAVFDPDGTHLSQTVDATVSGSTANVLSGFIGNVAQSNDHKPDTLRLSETGGQVLLTQSHSGSPPPPLQLGPLTGESWTNGCNGWAPVYAAKDVLSTSDVQLVPPQQAKDVRCFITGLTGAWSSTRNEATVQPFAEIYKGPTKDIRLRVSPTDENDRVGAYASCIRLR